MKRIFLSILIIGQLISCVSTGDTLRDDSGTFRGRWYNYYQRGLVHSLNNNWKNALENLQTSIRKRNTDQRMARTYGMHYIDYFPHRELGIVYFHTGEIDKAVDELKKSLRQEESAKAIYYLNKARKQQLLDQGTLPAPPEIDISSPAADSVVNDFVLGVKGQISGDGYISRLQINDRPYRIDLARKTIAFEQEIPVGENTMEIKIIAEDLLGNVTAKTMHLTVDREGPTINIFDIAAEAGMGDAIRVTGEVYDATGIGEILLNGEKIHPEGSKTYAFHLAIKRGPTGTSMSIKASDTLLNTTAADLDLERELSTDNLNEQPVLLASASDNLVPLDNKPPVILLKDSADLPRVFVSKYFVEGEVSDNNRVEEIMINGRELETKKGRKIFFSKVVGLNEGKNSIRVDAYDSAGNRARSGFTVNRDIPEAVQIGSRMSVSVLPFAIGENDMSLAELAYQQLIGAFIEQKRFKVIERQILEKVLLEQNLTAENLTEPKYSLQVGRIMAADTVLATSFSETVTSIEFIARVINTETSEVMDVEDVYAEDKSFSSIKQLMDGLASKIAGSFPLVKGIVIKRDSDYVFTDLGSKSKVMRDMGLIVYRNGDEIRHPVTGKSLGRNTINLGEGWIEDIHEEFSKAKLKDRIRAKDIVIQDMVITR